MHYNIEDSDIDDPESFLKVALTFSSDYDLNSYDPASAPPTCGDDFLKYVMYERSRCPEIVTATLDQNKIHNTVSYKFGPDEPPTEERIVTPRTLIPPLEWQKAQIENFEEIRRKVDVLRQRNIDKGIPFKKINKDNVIRYCETNDPMLSTVVLIRQPDIYYLLDMQANYLDNMEIGYDLPRFLQIWLFSCLALLEIPLLDDVYFTLRRIARKCIELRAGLPTEKQGENFVTPFNVMICLIGRYFNQTDLLNGHM